MRKTVFSSSHAMGRIQLLEIENLSFLLVIDWQLSLFLAMWVSPLVLQREHLRRARETRYPRMNASVTEVSLL